MRRKSWGLLTLPQRFDDESEGDEGVNMTKHAPSIEHREGDGAINGRFMAGRARQPRLLKKMRQTN